MVFLTQGFFRAFAPALLFILLCLQTDVAKLQCWVLTGSTFFRHQAGEAAAANSAAALAFPMHQSETFYLLFRRSQSSQAFPFPI